MHAILLCSCVILLVEVINAKIAFYDERSACGRIIQIGTRDQAARLVYRYNPYSGPHMCNITIETVDGYQTMGGYYHVAYAFLESELDNNFKCSTEIQYDNGYIADKYCGSNVYPKNTQITRDNTLELVVIGDRTTEFMFDLLLLSFHSGKCLNYETKCNGLLGDSTSGSACVDYSLVCHEAYTFCAATGSGCEDITKDSKSNGTVIAVIVTTLVFVLLVGVGCFLCYKKNFCGFLKRNPSEEDVRSRAMNIFSLQLAGRGVDGNDNTAYTDDEGRPIDFSKFDPPPEYSSLERLDNAGLAANGSVNQSDNAGATETDGVVNPEEVLPSYGDVMDRFDDYSVTTPI